MTGSLTIPRWNHTATLLPNGNVLVTGGVGDNGVYLADSELYDPRTGQWHPTGAMNEARAYHTANLLPDGKVLAVGGINTAYTSLTSAELYDPATESWTMTGAMNRARSYHTATLLVNGKVLVAAGGDYFTPSVASTELYDPTTRKWTMASTLFIPRNTHASVLLTDGRVLIAGGFVYYDVTNSAELFDIGLGFSNSWQPQIATFTSLLDLDSNLVITGSTFRGISGASGGNSQDSSTDYPLVQLRSIESGQTKFLQTTNWSTNSFTSLPVWNFLPGWAMATVFVNGIPSTSSIVNITVPVPSPPTITDAKKLTNGSFQFRFTNSVGAVFGALASTNLSLQPSNWTALSGVTEISPGRFQFTDSQATNGPQRFYRVRAD